MNKFGKNTLSNIAAKIWNMVSVYIFIPFYIRILGETSYGLISFFATLQTSLLLLGLGLSNTLRREFAVSEFDDNDKQKKYLLLRSVETVYFVIGFVIILICFFGASFIANKWLNIESLNPKTVTNVISLMGISISLQMIANLYAGCLFGLDYQVLANACAILWSAAKSIGSLFIIWAISPNLILFYGWHIFVDCIYLFVVRIFVKTKLQLKESPRWKLSDLRNMKTIWRYTLGILFISLIALINKQLDKLIISKYLLLSELGAYNSATTLGSATGIISSALYVSVFTRFTKDATGGNKEHLTSNFKVVNKVVNILLSCMGCFIAVYSLPLIELWTGSHNYVEILGRVGFLAVLAVTLIEFQQIPYALALANGNTKINVLVGGLFMPFVAVSTLFAIKDFGLLGAGVVYFVMMACQTFLYEFMVYKEYLEDNPIKLIFTDTLLPLISALVIALVSQKIVYSLTDNTALISFFAVVNGALAVAILFLAIGRKELNIFFHLRED